MMGRRWIVAAAGFALLLGMATFPMRLALSMAGASEAGISARTVRGTVWSGELVDARLGALPFGTVTANLSPLALLTGGIELAFARKDDRLGPLSGRLYGSDPRGVADVNGTISLTGGLGAVPIDMIRLEGASVRFDDTGRCVSAGGRAQLSVAAPIAGLDLSRGLAGPLSCVNGRAQAALSSQSGMERLVLTFDGTGAWRAQLAIDPNGDTTMAAALAALGFRPGAGGLVLATTGRF